MIDYNFSNQKIIKDGIQFFLAVDSKFRIITTADTEIVNDRQPPKR